VLKSVHYASFLQQSVQQQIVLSIRSLCSLPSLLIYTVVSQVAVLPSSNSKATASLLCLLPVPILFQLILIYLNFSRECVKKAAWSVLSQQASSHVWSHIHTRLLTVSQTVVRREQSDLINNTICSCTDCCWKGAKQPDRQHYLLSHRPL